MKYRYLSVEVCTSLWICTGVSKLSIAPTKPKDKTPTVFQPKTEKNQCQKHLITTLTLPCRSREPAERPAPVPSVHPSLYCCTQAGPSPRADLRLVVVSSTDNRNQNRIINALTHLVYILVLSAIASADMTTIFIPSTGTERPLVFSAAKQASLYTVANCILRCIAEKAFFNITIPWHCNCLTDITDESQHLPMHHFFWRGGETVPLLSVLMFQK